MNHLEHFRKSECVRCELKEAFHSNPLAFYVKYGGCSVEFCIAIGWNVLSPAEVHHDKIGSMFEECKLDILGLSERKLRGEGEFSFGVLEFSNLG